VAAQAAAALTPGHDDAMHGVSGDTLRDVHRSGVAEFGRSLGIALADRPPARRSARVIISHTCSVRKSTRGIGRVETVGAASAPLQPRSARKCCDRPRVKISTREDQLERDLSGKVSRPRESARKRTPFRPEDSNHLGSTIPSHSHPQRPTRSTWPTSAPTFTAAFRPVPVPQSRRTTQENRLTTRTPALG
jgi:hypothetical protein